MIEVLILQYLNCIDMSPDSPPIEEREQLQKEIRAIDGQIKSIERELTAMVEYLRGFATARQSLARFQAEKQQLLDRLEGVEAPTKTASEKFSELQQQLDFINESLGPTLKDIYALARAERLPISRPIVLAA